VKPGGIVEKTLKNIVYHFQTLFSLDRVLENLGCV
jgi:hypothetical protein